MSDVTLLRLGILVVGLVLIAAIFFFGQPKKPSQGKKTNNVDKAAESRASQRCEPMLNNNGLDADEDGLPVAKNVVQDEQDFFISEPELSFSEVPKEAPEEDIGKREQQDFEKIVVLYVAARAGQILHGEDVVVAAEKTGMVFGHMDIFHRMIEGYPERGPVFSMASILNPGSFDMGHIRTLKIPAIAFFLTLPTSVAALDAWEMMLPTAQRMAELLDSVVLDDERNALGRQRIAHIRDDLRAYDRKQEALIPPLVKPPRW